MIDPHRAWPPLSRGGLDRAAALRDDTEALREGWPTARLLRVNGLGQVRLMEKHVLLEPASDRYFEPSEHAVLLGVFDGDHEWAVRGDEGFNDCLLPGRCDGSLGSSWTRRSRCGVDRRWCCGWTTDRISYPLCCNSSAGIG